MNSLFYWVSVSLIVITCADYLTQQNDNVLSPQATESTHARDMKDELTTFAHNLLKGHRRETEYTARHGYL